MLHHGRGTDEADLLGLADALDPERRLHVASPRGPLTPSPAGPATTGTRSRGSAIRTRRPSTPASAPGGLPRRALGEDRDRARADGPRGVLDGLGDELRARAFRTATPGPRGSWPSPASYPWSRDGSPSSPRGRGLPVFIAHGRNDPIMEVEFARRARELLESVASRSPTTSPMAPTRSIRPTCRRPGSCCRRRSLRPEPSPFSRSGSGHTAEAAAAGPARPARARCGW